MSKSVKYTIAGLFFLVLMAVPFMGGLLVGKRAFSCPPITKVDTLIVLKDTVIYKPKEVVRWRVRTDTVLLAKVDTTSSEDSAASADSSLVEVPIEQKYFEGEKYEAWISGFRTKIDSLKITSEYVYLTKYVKEKERHFGWGVSVGPSVVYNGKVHAGIGVTGGITYKF